MSLQPPENAVCENTYTELNTNVDLLKLLNDGGCLQNPIQGEIDQTIEQLSNLSDYITYVYDLLEDDGYGEDVLDALTTLDLNQSNLSNVINTDLQTHSNILSGTVTNTTSETRNFLNILSISEIQTNINRTIDSSGNDNIQSHLQKMLGSVISGSTTLTNMYSVYTSIINPTIDSLSLLKDAYTNSYDVETIKTFLEAIGDSNFTSELSNYSATLQSSHSEISNRITQDRSEYTNAIEQVLKYTFSTGISSYYSKDTCLKETLQPFLTTEAIEILETA